MYSLTAVANSEWLYGTCTQDWLLLHVGTNQLFKNVETMFDNKSQCTRSHLGFKTYTNAGVKVLFPWYHYPNTHKPLYHIVCARTFLTFKTWQKSEPDLQIQKYHSYSCIYDLHMQIRDMYNLWWRLSFTQSTCNYVDSKHVRTKYLNDDSVEDYHSNTIFP